MNQHFPQISRFTIIIRVFENLFLFKLQTITQHFMTLPFKSHFLHTTRFLTEDKKEEEYSKKWQFNWVLGPFNCSLVFSDAFSTFHVYFRSRKKFIYALVWIAFNWPYLSNRCFLFENDLQNYSSNLNMPNFRVWKEKEEKKICGKIKKAAKWANAKSMLHRRTIRLLTTNSTQCVHASKMRWDVLKTRCKDWDMSLRVTSQADHTAVQPMTHELQFKAILVRSLNFIIEWDFNRIVKKPKYRV